VTQHQWPEGDLGRQHGPGRENKQENRHLFNISIPSGEFHRDSIRKKIGLNQQNCDLRVLLRNLSEQRDNRRSKDTPFAG
jgi:hypothetical protein